MKRKDLIILWIWIFYFRHATAVAQINGKIALWISYFIYMKAHRKERKEELFRAVYSKKKMGFHIIARFQFKGSAKAWQKQSLIPRIIPTNDIKTKFLLIPVNQLVYATQIWFILLHPSHASWKCPLVNALYLQNPRVEAFCYQFLPIFAKRGKFFSLKCMKWLKSGKIFLALEKKKEKFW